MGRAARHINGSVILYADRVTNSMQRAIDETTRRRNKQKAFNKKYGIIPKGVVKPIVDILDTDLSASEIAEIGTRDDTGSLVTGSARQGIKAPRKGDV